MKTVTVLVIVGVAILAFYFWKSGIGSLLNKASDNSSLQ